MGVHVTTSDLKDFRLKEKEKAPGKKKIVQTRDLSNEQIDKARDQGEENGKETEQPDTE